MRYVYDLIDIGDALALVVGSCPPSARSFPKILGSSGLRCVGIAQQRGLDDFDVFYNGHAVGTLRTRKVTRLYARLYWTNDVIVDLLRFLLVIWLTYRATSAVPNERRLGASWRDRGGGR